MMMIRIILGFQIFVLSILSEEFELESLSSNEVGGINKRYPSYMNALINRYNAASPNSYSSSGLIFHWDCTKYYCSEYPHGNIKCVSLKYYGSKYKHRLLGCKKRAPDSQVADPKKWKPHPACLPVFYYDKWYIKGCKIDEIPFCYTRQDDYRGWKYCIDISNVDGVWSEWSAWIECSKTCGPDSGSRSRVRECNNPSPQDGGKDCPGEKKESEECDKSECPIHGGWSQWSEASSCYETCGTRERECDNPSPKFGGRDCEGPKIDEIVCSAECPVDGNWTLWSEWTKCEKSCGEESKIRSRSCTNPRPQKDGKDCQGEDSEALFCYHKPCPGDLKKMSNLSSKVVFPIIASIGALLLTVFVVAAVMYRKKKKGKLASTTGQSLVYQESGLD